MIDNGQFLEFLELMICPSCFKSNFFRNESFISCKSCNQKFSVFKNQTVIFEKVYEPINKSNNFYELPKYQGAKNWRDLNSTYISNWSRSVKESDYVLDLGCGPLTNFHFLKHAKTIYIDGGLFDDINMVCNFEKKIFIRDNSVDKILLSNVLEHIYKPSILFAEMHRVLKVDADCLVLVPFIIKHHQEPFDFNRYTRHYLKRLSLETGFKIICIKEIGSISNILGTFLRIQKKEKKDTNKIDIKTKIIYFIRDIIYLLYRLDRKLSKDEKASNSSPQGFLLHLKKI